MPLQTIEPEVKELTAWPGGYMPDPDPSMVPLEALLDANNLIPDRGGTGALVTRKGVKRFGTFVLDGYRVKAMHPFNVVYGTIAGGKRFLMVVAVKYPEARDVADNFEIIRINVDDGTWTRVDDATRAWRSLGGHHFGVTVDNVYYGAAEQDPVYAYRPYYSNGVEASAAIAWDPDATMPQRASNAWADATAYALHDRVEDGGYVWVCHLAHTSAADKRPKNGINSEDYWTRLATRWNDWATAQPYKVGDKVMRSVVGNSKFPRGLAGRTINTYSSFICVRAHTSAAGNTPPSWAWEPFRAPVSNVGLYHGSRLFMRDTDSGTSRVRYSARVKADGLFDPSDWEAEDVQGPGYFDIRTGDGDDVRAFAELGNMLVVWKRHSTHVLAGLNPSTWALRQVAPVGCVDKRAWAELNGALYFLGDDGFFMTDGALVQPVPGSDVINQYIKANVEWIASNDPGINKNPTFRCVAYDNRIWFTVPKESGTPFTLVYDPMLQSFWPVSFATWQFAVQSVDKLDQLFLGSKDAPALVLQYDHPTAANQDDTRVVVAAMQDIPWHMRTGWLNFGTANEDRKLRRTWARVRATSKTITLKLYKNFAESVVWTVNTLISGTTGTVEGKKQDSAQAVSFRIEGTASPVTILGLAIHSQFRRKRYHRV